MSNGDTIKKVLEVEDKFSNSLNNFKRKLKEVGTQSDKTDDDLEDLNEEVKKTGSNSAKAVPKVKKLDSAFDKMGKSVKGVVAAYIGMRGLEMAKDLALASAEAESVSQSFDRMAESVGYYGDELTASMRKATDNMVNDVTLQKNAMKALISGIDPEAMLVSMQYVSRYAASVGADSEQLMQTVMTGLARGSAQFLDDVGIQVMGSTDVVGDAVDQMKEKMLELNEVPFTNIEQFTTRLENLKIEVGSYLTPVIDDLVTLMGDLMNTISPEEADRMGESFSLILAGIVKGFAVLGMGVDHVMSTINTRINQTLLFTTSLGAGFQEVALGILTVSESIDNILTPKQFETANVSTDMINSIRESQAEVEALSLELANQLLLEESGADARKDIWKEFILRIDSATESMGGLTSATQSNTNSVIEGVIANDKLTKSIDNGNTAKADRIAKLETLARIRAKNIEIAAKEAEDEEARVEARRDLVSQSISTATELASAMSSIHSSKMSEIKREFDYEEERIKNSTMSRKKKEKALEGLAENRKKAEIESAKRQVLYTTLVGAGTTALAIQKSILAIIGAGAETAGGVFVKAGAMIAMAGATAGYVAQIKSAQAQIPKREYGGAMRRNELYEVAERNKDEMFTSGGKNYFMPSNGGMMTPDVKGGNTTVNMNVTFGAGTDTQTIEQRLPSMIAKGLEMADRNGDIDYGRMPTFQREVGR